MKLQRDYSCIRCLSWRTQLPDGSDCNVLQNDLLHFGFHPAQTTEFLRILRTNDGNEILLVPKTGRVQIRVHYTIPEAQRRFKAEEIFCALVKCVIQLPSSKPDQVNEFSS